MDFSKAIHAVQDFRSAIEGWNLSTEVLLLAGFVALFFYVLSAREVLTWFLRSNQIRDEVRALRAQISEMQETLNQLKEKGATPVAPAERESQPAGENHTGSKFRLDHWRNSL